ncbi:uncharacterized protein LOC132721427 isoform X2 [Ruditapes philippinarum]|uniref:uncharacterized protein LOC132721427 isoform X2 n=1 Tax=Ruditapes philippinarum TaxID=129788 RepID=UPI00295BBB47|nr:uncharacterized protein LOC132721427 isoform X2 [Ruditapes philippinarum]
MTLLKQCVISSVILAGMAVLLQTICFIIPGWFITETKVVSVNMAVWYVIFCESKQNGTLSDSCGTMSYKELFSGINGKNLAQLGAMFTSVVGTQVQVTACLILAAGAFMLIIFQFKTFHQQTPGQPSIFVDEPRGTCNVRAKFIYSGGFSAIFQLFSGILLGLVIIDFGKKYYALGKPRPAIPYTLFIAGIGAACSGLCGIIELAIAFRTKENGSRRSSNAADKHCSPQQLIPLNQVQGQGKGPHHHHHHHHHHYDKQARTVSLDDGDYYGQDYDVENPAFHTQGGRKSDASSSLFPGYRLGRQNLQGHDKKWWRKVTFAAFTVL